MLDYLLYSLSIYVPFLCQRATKGPAPIFLKTQLRVLQIGLSLNLNTCSDQDSRG